MISHLKGGDASSRFERETAVKPISMSFHWISVRDFFQGAKIVKLTANTKKASRKIISRPTLK